MILDTQSRSLCISERPISAVLKRLDELEDVQPAQPSAVAGRRATSTIDCDRSLAARRLRRRPSGVAVRSASSGRGDTRFRAVEVRQVPCRRCGRRRHARIWHSKNPRCLAACSRALLRRRARNALDQRVALSQSCALRPWRICALKNSSRSRGRARVCADLARAQRYLGFDRNAL